MDFVRAFLFCSGVAYYCCLVLPKPCTKNIRPVWLEKLAMFLSGTVILLNLLVFNHPWAWLCMGVFWTFASILSYLGYSQWNVLWREDLSDEAQVAMWAWDLAIAVCCLMLS